MGLNFLQNEHDNLIQSILDEENTIIEQHKNLIDKDSQSKYIENEILNRVEKPGSSIQEYINSLESLLNHKSKNIMKLHNKVLYFKNLLSKEKQMYEKIRKIQNEEEKQEKKESYLFDSDNIEQMINKENLMF